MFTEHLEQARLHVARHGHLAVAHTDTSVRQWSGLGRWLANRRADAVSLSAQQHALLQELDPWWNPPWPLDWQRAWYRMREHVSEHGPVQGGDNLGGAPRWVQRWLRDQVARYEQLHPGQQGLLGELGLSEDEVRRFRAWPGRRRPAADGLGAARTYAARHGHLAVGPPTAAGAFALGRWLNSQRARQRGPSGPPAGA
ncbi:helicase associated domain-containing protein [Streptomyces collinus]|uniref:helicase associated domain-containing protein n=1 Tax=Streptomyces collinus TaxID=42684 RepID=UPI0036A66171